MKLFVYGTLKRGRPAATMLILGGAKFTSFAKTTAAYTMYNFGAYPGVVIGGNTVIEGEIWEIDGPMLNKLDWYEGYPHLYDRVNVWLPDAKEVAIMYVYRGDGTIKTPEELGKQKIESGVWK